MAFLHPNPFDWSSWMFQMAHLSTWFRTVAVDLPGYGTSPPSTDGVTIADVAEACWDAIGVATDEQVVLAGVSVGAHLALHMAHLRADRVSAVILSGTAELSPPVRALCLKLAHSYESRGMAFRAEHAPRNFSAAFRESQLGRHLVEMLLERNVLADARTIAWMFRSLADDKDDVNRPLRAPTLIISGSEDAMHSGARGLQRTLGCELAVIEGAGHSCNLEQPWAWDAAALEFLGRHGLGGVSQSGLKPDPGQPA